MVWIHGGAFILGSNSKDFYNPEFLLRKDVVLIAINYRLGCFGKITTKYAYNYNNNGVCVSVCATSLLFVLIRSTLNCAYQQNKCTNYSLLTRQVHNFCFFRSFERASEREVIRAYRNWLKPHFVVVVFINTLRIVQM